MNLDRAEEFLKSKGVDTEKYVIHDINGGYLPQIPIASWLEEFAQQEVKNNSILLDVSKSVCECKDEWLVDVRLNVMRCKKCGQEF